MVKLVSKNLFIFFISCYFFSCFNNNSLNALDQRYLKAKNLLNNEEYGKAKVEFENILLNDPLFSTEILFYLAESKFHLSNYDDAILEYNQFIKQASTDRGIDNSLYLQSRLKIAKCYYNLSNDIKKDQTNTYVALNKLQTLIENDAMFNYHEEIEKMIFNLRTKLAEKDYQTALLYMKIGEDVAATVYFKSIVSDYYDTDFIDSSLLNIALIKKKSNVELAKKYLKDNQSYFTSNGEFEDAFQKVNN